MDVVDNAVTVNAEGIEVERNNANYLKICPWTGFVSCCNETYHNHRTSIYVNC